MRSSQDGPASSAPSHCVLSARLLPRGSTQSRVDEPDEPELSSLPWELSVASMGVCLALTFFFKGKKSILLNHKTEEYRGRVTSDITEARYQNNYRNVHSCYLISLSKP